MPDKKRYRTFHVKGVADGDDYGAMYEVLARRFRRGQGRQAGSRRWPSGAADPETRGGRRQAGDVGPARSLRRRRRPRAARRRARGGARSRAPRAAHRRPRQGAGERGRRDAGRPRLPARARRTPSPCGHDSSLFFLARVRDEAHRFSNRARKRLGKTRRLRSELDDVPGLGAETKKALLRELGSMAGPAGGQRRAHPRGHRASRSAT